MGNHISRWGQVKIYVGKCFRLFMTEKQWKNFVSTFIIVVLIAIVTGKDMFYEYSETRKGAFALVCACSQRGEIKVKTPARPAGQEDMIGYAAAWLDGYALGEGMAPIGIFSIVEHGICAPPAFFVHRSPAEILHIFLYVLRLLLGADEDSVRTGRYDYVTDTVDENRILEFVDDVDVVTFRAEDGIPDGMLAKFVGKCVPGTEIFPFSGIRDHCDRRGLFSHLVVKADFREFRIS